MKFGKIMRHTIDSRMPHWREHCVNYKKLKVALKKQLAQGVDGARRACASFPSTRRRGTLRVRARPPRRASCAQWVQSESRAPWNHQA